MNNCARHIIYAISLFLTLSLIFDAFADAFSDALGIHVSKEAENKHT